MTTADLASSLGRPGKFQVTLLLMLVSGYIYVSWNFLLMAFIGAQTGHRCRIENSSQSLVSIITKDKETKWAECYLYSDLNKTKEILCPNGWTFEQANKVETIVVEWDLVCDNAYKTSLATTIFFCGVSLGTLVFGALSDKFGRRPVVLITMYSPSIAGLGLFFCQNYVAFVILRFVLGFLLEGLQIVLFITIIELFALQYRATVGLLASTFWSVGVMSLAPLVYFIQDWRYIQLFTASAGLFHIVLICFLPESFRWLLIKKRVQEAEVVVKKIATFNSKPFPVDVFDKVAQRSKDVDIDELKPKKNHTIIDIFRFPTLRRRSLVVSIMWFSSAFCYYGLSLNATNLAGNKYLNFSISGLLETIITVVSILVLNRFGRRKPLCLYSIIAGVTCTTAGILSKSAGPSLGVFVTSFAVIGRAFAHGCSAILYVYTSEIYPTVIRNVGLGAGTFCARLGTMIAPQVILLEKYTSSAVPFIIYGALTFFPGVLCLFLPETLNVRLPETIEDAGKFYKTREIVRMDDGQNCETGLVLVDSTEPNNP